MIVSHTYPGVMELQIVEIYNKIIYRRPYADQKKQNGNKEEERKKEYIRKKKEQRVDTIHYLVLEQMI